MKSQKVWQGIYGLWQAGMFAGVIGLLAIGCSSQQESEVGEDVPVAEIMTGTYPLSYITKVIVSQVPDDELGFKIGYADFDGGDPHHDKPTLESIQNFQKADFIFLNGAGFEGWAEQVSLPENRVVRTADLTDIEYVELEGVKHQHGPDGEHSHGQYASVTWLDFSQVIKQGEVVRDTLIRKFPDYLKSFEAGFHFLEVEFATLDDELMALTEGRDELLFLASHPVYQYFSERYGLDVASVSWEVDQMPSQEEWDAFEILIGQHPARWMLWEGEPLPEVREKLTALGIEIIIFDPCENPSSIGHFRKVMRSNVTSFRDALLQSEDG